MKEKKNILLLSALIILVKHWSITGRNMECHIAQYTKKQVKSRLSFINLLAMENSKMKRTQGP